MNMNEAMWTEKYRPETLDDVVGQEVAVDRLQRWLNEGGLPHLLLAGPPGVGKTAAIESYGRDLYGDTFDANFREFNASDARGIDVVREKIKPWCRKAPAGGHAYKIVFLDEADALTSDAQPALRRVMEGYSDSTRFVLSCNYVNQIIDPLQSRCASFHFGRLADAEVRDLLWEILNAEAIVPPEGQDNDDLDATVGKIVRASRGRARDAVLTLQLSVEDGELHEDAVDVFTGVVDDGLVEEILTLALNGEISDAQRRLDVEVLKAGANPNHLLDSVFRVLRKLDLPPDYRAKTFELLATVEERLQMGLNPHVQFHALLAHLYMAQGLSSIAQQQEGA